MRNILIGLSFGMLCGTYGYFVGVMRERSRAVSRDLAEWKAYRDSFFTRVAMRSPCKGSQAR